MKAEDYQRKGLIALGYEETPSEEAPLGVVPNPIEQPPVEMQQSDLETLKDSDITIDSLHSRRDRAFPCTKKKRWKGERMHVELMYSM